MVDAIAHLIAAECFSVVGVRILLVLFCCNASHFVWCIVSNLLIECVVSLIRFWFVAL